MTVSITELSSVVNNLRDFFKPIDKTDKCLQIPLTKAKIEIGSLKSKDNLFAHYFCDITEHPNRQIRSSFRFGNNNSCIFPIGKFNLHGSQFILTDFVNLNRRAIHHLDENRL